MMRRRTTSRRWERARPDRARPEGRQQAGPGSKSEGDPIVGKPGASATHQAIIRKGERQVQPAVGSHHEADESSEASSPLAGGAADGGAPTCCGTGRASSSDMSSELRHKSEQSVWKKKC